MRASRLKMGLVVAGLVLAAIYLVLFHTYEAPAVDPAWAVSGSTQFQPGSVRVRYTGCSTLVISDGETTDAKEDLDRAGRDTGDVQLPEACGGGNRIGIGEIEGVAVIDAVAAAVVSPSLPAA